MKFWIIALILGLMAAGTLLVTSTGTVTAEEPEQIQCSSCGNSCSTDSNCGLASCGAVSGGSCGCGR